MILLLSSITSKTCTPQSNVLFFLEYAVELRIIILIEEKKIPYKYHHLTPDRSVRDFWIEDMGCVP